MTLSDVSAAVPETKDKEFHEKALFKTASATYLSADHISYLGCLVSDYDPLREYLSQQTAIELVLTFDQIEDILGFALPRASQRATWWEKERNPENARPQRDAIRDGGYEATRLGDGKGVRFRKLTAGRFKPKH